MPVFLRLFAALLLLFVLCPATDVHAVIYQYTDEKGNPALVDDLGKVPEAQRGKAVIVSGQTETGLTNDPERDRAIAVREAIQRAAMQQRTDESSSFSGRIIRGGVAIALAIGIILALTHIDALREQAELLRRIRLSLVLVLLAFLGVNFARDVAGLFRSVGKEISDPVADLRDRQWEKGRKAAESYKTMDKALQEQAQQEMERIQKQIEDTEGDGSRQAGR